MKIAYLILAHKAPDHLSRLVRALDSPNAAFFVHVDRKTDIWPFRNWISRPNVTFLEKRVPVYWGEFSIVQATINLMSEAVKQVPLFHNLVLLSGSDYPLRSPNYIEAYFLQNQGYEFINLVPMPCEALSKRLDRLQQYRLQTPNDNQFVGRAVARLNDLINDRLGLKREYSRAFKSLLPYAGSQWWALTADACRYILSFIDSSPDVVKFFKIGRAHV